MAELQETTPARLESEPSLTKGCESPAQQLDMGVFDGVAPMEAIILWMNEILHHLETMGNHCLLVFTGESCGAGFRPSTVLDFTNSTSSTQVAELCPDC